MKTKRIFPLAAALAFAAIAQGAHAADGTINFTGSISAQTCTVNGNGSGGKNFSVALPGKLPTSVLTKAGETAGRTPFSIALSGCTPNTGNVHVFFEPGGTVDLASGYLKLNSGGASNVQIRMLNADLSVIKAGVADASQNSKPVALSGGAATLQYFAEYVATGAATAGAANSSVTYTVAYQ